jgi:hypothetical protein
MRNYGDSALGRYDSLKPWREIEKKNMFLWQRIVLVLTLLHFNHCLKLSQGEETELNQLRKSAIEVFERYKKEFH